MPLSCGNVPSGRGYALVHGHRCLGIGLGTLLGSVAAFVGQLRLVYGMEAFCMTAVLILISPLHPLEDSRTRPGKDSARMTEQTVIQWPALAGPLLPVLAVGVIATGILALQQSALPLDLVKVACSAPL